jgi:signal transduction histidine kinase
VDRHAVRRRRDDGAAGGNAVWSIAEDRHGRIYFGTGRGLDRLDPATGALRHFTIADGLAGDIINQCIADRQGAIWVATPTGLSRLMPEEQEATAAAPLTYLTRIQIVGDDVRVAETGVQHGPALTLAANRNSLLLQYVAPSFRREHRLHYQYRLDGLDHEWTPPTEEHTVTYARLPPGSYRFQVRAIGDAAAPGEPAVFEFTIRPPFWRQWWFLTLAVLSMAALLFGIHRLRMRRLIALQTVRNQIATDLHDDIGAGLAQVAILSEVARRQTPSASNHLADIAALARTMRDSMSDIVWAIDPKKDRVTHLADRMRQFAVNTLASDGTRVDFQAPHDSALESVALTPDRRRHLLLILKEAVTNVARHAGASQVTIALGIADRTIHLTVEDDGRGFDPSTVREGHGLGNLRSRSRDLGGDLQIHAAPGRGTRLVVQIPIR